MQILKSFRIFVLHIVFLTIVTSSLAQLLNRQENLKFSHLINRNRAGFIVSPYYIPKHSGFPRDYRSTRCKLSSDEAHTRHGTLSEFKDAKSTLSSKATELKTLVLTSSSKVSAKVNRLLTKVKESRGYRLLSKNLEALRNHMLRLSVIEQFCLLLAGKAVYSFLLPMYHITFPFQLFPMDSGLGVDIGLDTLFSVPLLYNFLKESRFPPNFFKMPEKSGLKVALVVSSLVGSFYLSSFFSAFVDGLVLMVSALDFPVSPTLLNSISVFSGHLFWITIGSLVLHNTLFPVLGKANPWYKVDVKKTWVYPVLSGYVTSCGVYKLVDTLVALVLKNFGSESEESPTDKNINEICSSKEPFSILMASLAPCVTAPWWEEILYRVFTFKVFNSFLPSLPSSIISSTLFSLNHLNPRSFFQLFALGLTWSTIQNEADNLFVPFLIHVLWNSRIFIGSITGL